MIAFSRSFLVIGASDFIIYSHLSTTSRRFLWFYWSINARTFDLKCNKIDDGVLLVLLYLLGVLLFVLLHCHFFEENANVFFSYLVCHLEVNVIYGEIL